MGGPWEKYGQAAPAQTDAPPWEKYGATAPPNAGLALPAGPGINPGDFPSQTIIPRIASALGNVGKNALSSMTAGAAPPQGVFEQGYNVPAHMGEETMREIRSLNPISPKFKAGDNIGGAIETGGNLISDFLQLKGLHRGGGTDIVKPSGPTPVEVAAAPVRATVAAANAALHTVPGIVGAGVGALGGHPISGYYAGKTLFKNVNISGENFFRPSSYDQAAMQRAGLGQPPTPPLESPAIPQFPQRETYPARGPIQGPQFQVQANGPQRATSLVDTSASPNIPPREVYPARGPIQGPKLRTPNPGPQRAATLVDTTPSRVTPSAAQLATPEGRQAFLDGIAAKRQGLGINKYAPAADAPPPAHYDQPTIPTENEVAKGMGFPGGSQQAIQRLGPQAWYQNYAKYTTAATNTAKVGPIGQPTPFGNPAEKVAPQDFQWTNPNAPRQMTQSQRLLDNIDDQALKQRLQQQMDSDQAQSFLIKGRNQAAVSGADVTKLANQNNANRLSNLPLPNATIEANKLLGYNPRKPR